MASWGGDLPLPKPAKGAMLSAELLLSGEFSRMILASEPLGIPEM